MTKQLFEARSRIKELEKERQEDLDLVRSCEITVTESVNKLKHNPIAFHTQFSQNEMQRKISKFQDFAKASRAAYKDFPLDQADAVIKLCE